MKRNRIYLVPVKVSDIEYSVSVLSDDSSLEIVMLVPSGTLNSWTLF